MGDLDDEAITVTLPAEEGAAVITKVEEEKKQTPQAADDPILDLKGQFETLKGTLNQATQRLVGAERQLQDRDQELAKVRQEITASQLDTVLTGIQAAEAEADAAERAYIQAYEAGDSTAMARAQRKIAGAEAKVQRLREAEGDLKEQVSAKPEPRQEVRRQQQDDPVKRFTAGMSPQSAAWIERHPECVTDPKMNARMLAAHNLAIADDIPVDSDEYFARIEAGIVTKAAAKPAVTIRPTAPVAPGNASGGGMNGGGQTVTLTAREAQAAVDGTHVWNTPDPTGKNRWKVGDPIGTVEFGRRKLAMMKEGHYDRSRDLQ